VTELPKAAAGEPGLTWNYKPNPKSATELLEQRREQNLNDLKALEGRIGSIKNAE
jgi:hypothetical protein